MALSRAQRASEQPMNVDCHVRDANQQMAFFAVPSELHGIT